MEVYQTNSYANILKSFILGKIPKRNNTAKIIILINPYYATKTQSASKKLSNTSQ